MSRTSEMYKFVDMDADQIDADVVSIYSAITGKPTPTGMDLLFCRILSSVCLYNAANTNYAANENLPSRADGKDLDALAEMYFEQSRPQATYAGCQMKFTISEAQSTAILVPAGTRVANSDQTVFFSTDDDLYIGVGETEGSVHATCQTVGTAGNGYSAGDINKCVDVFPYYDSCENTDDSGGGSDVPDDDAFYDLLVQSQDAYSSGGSEGAYVYFAKKASSQIADVVVNTPSDGVVKIYCLMDDGTIAGEEVKALVDAQCDAEEHRPMTDHVIISDPEEVEYTVQLTYYLQNGTGASAIAMQSAITQAVAEYVVWQSGKLGRDIVPDELVARIKQAGAKRCVITSPVYTVLRDGTITQDTDISDGEDVPQIAKCTNIVLTNGGYEDE